MERNRSSLRISIICYICLLAISFSHLICCASIAGPKDGPIASFDPYLIRRDDAVTATNEKVTLYRRAVEKTLAAAAKNVVSHVKSTKAITEAPKLAHQPSLSRSSSSVSRASHSLSRSNSIAHHAEASRGRSMARGNPTTARYHSEPPPGSRNLAHTSWRNIKLSKETKKNSAIAGGAAALGVVLGNVQFTTPSVDLNLVHHGGRKMSMNTQFGQGGISSNLNAGGTSINMNKMTRSRSFGGHGSEPEY
ncbi:uncharacterized protein FA14DRAFT_156409 [Meira miltonrushii]|uniref:Uncharacterized protein n=1 Tax=Meira miltonrushii TaxID=1280837 RepID=A0A316VE37_9BASI|nr:uncharacterized protein FA14DRAFT_156409 [Meira miltonrushii]PWN33725.1 hypothetical protein FA14DRAFT_156409 [Meira miltonrushii]